MAKTVPWAEVLAYPLGATPVAVRRGFALTDQLARLQRDPKAAPPDAIFGDMPDRYVGGVRLTTPQLARGTGQLTDVDNLLWWDLVDQDEDSSVSGYTVAPFLCPRNNQLAWHPTEGHYWAVVGSTKYYCLEWLPVPQENAPCYWEECTPDAEPQTTAIVWKGSQWGQRYLAETALPLPANQNWAMRLWWKGSAPWREGDDANAPFFHVTWGGGAWDVQFSPLKPPQLGRNIRNEWRPVRTFEGFDVDPFLAGEPVWLKVFHIAGRLVVRLEPVGGKSTQVVYTEFAAKPWQGKEIRPVVSPLGSLALSGNGVTVTGQLHEIKWGRWVPEEENEYGVVTAAHLDGDGSFKREYTCTRKVSASATKAAAFGYYGGGNPHRRQGFPEGDAGTVASVQDAPLSDEFGHNLGKREYTCTLRAHNPILEAVEVSPPPVVGDYLAYTPTAMCGAATPLVHSVAIRLGHTTTKESLAPIDLRPALMGMEEDLADPALQAGPSWSFRLNRKLLADCLHTDTGLPVGGNWPQYVNKYHRIVANVAWQYADGTIAAIEDDGTSRPKVCRLDGFITSRDLEAPKFGEYPGTITARDPCVLLQQPAGIVDGRFGPLDTLLMEKLDIGERKLMGWEGVQYILETAIGPDWADELQTWFAADHYDLIKHAVLLNPPHGSWFFPPPFGRDVYQWIQQLAVRDFAIFFFGPKIADPTQLVPNYGNYYEYLAGMPELELPDAVYGGSDLDRLMQSAGGKQEPRHDYNRVLIWGKSPGQQDLGGVMPALPAWSAEARIESGSPVDEQNIEDTWERTLVLDGSEFWLWSVARVVALNFMRLVRGIDVRAIPITVRGHPYLWWGWKVRPKMTAPASDEVDIDGQLCRIMRVRNKWDLERGRWDTTIRAAPEPE